jgi:hypothetical protein
MRTNYVLQNESDDMNMDNFKNEELENFMKYHEVELGEVTKSLEEAKERYEEALKSFVINHITSKANFKTRFNDSLRDMLDHVVQVPIWDVIGDSGVNTLTYQNMIDDEMYWLKEGQFDV